MGQSASVTCVDACFVPMRPAIFMSRVRVNCTAGGGACGYEHLRGERT